MLAFILTNVELGEEEEVEKKVSKIPEVEEVHRVYGMYDMVIKVKFDGKEKLRNVVFRRIRGIQGVRKTMALMTIE